MTAPRMPTAAHSPTALRRTLPLLGAALLAGFSPLGAGAAVVTSRTHWPVIGCDKLSEPYENHYS